MIDALDRAVVEGQAAVNAALAAPLNAHAAFVTVGPRANGDYDRGVVLFESGKPFAWSGLGRVPLGSPADGIELVSTSIYDELRVTRTEGTRRATAFVLLDAVSPGDSVARPLTRLVASQTGVSRIDVLPATGSTASGGRSYSVNGKPLLDVSHGQMAPEDGPAPPRFLPMWDNVLTAYRDRSRVVPEAYRRVIGKNNGDTLPSVLVDGYVAGVWRPAPEAAGGIEVTAFHRLDTRTWEELEREARSLVRFLRDRDPNVYSRYNHWWKAMPSAQVRVLGR